TSTARARPSAASAPCSARRPRARSAEGRSSARPGSPVMALQPVRVGLLGLGTVGGGTVNVLSRNAEEISRRAGRGIEVVAAAVRNPERQRPVSEQVRIVSDPAAVVNDPAVEIVCELIGGTAAAKDLVLAAIEKGKHVVTANNALIALHGNEIFEAARRNGVIVAF